MTESVLTDETGMILDQCFAVAHRQRVASNVQTTSGGELGFISRCNETNDRGLTQTHIAPSDSEAGPHLRIYSSLELDTTALALEDVSKRYRAPPSSRLFQRPA
jgi:hypothetical protein